MSAQTPWLSIIMPVHHGAHDLPATLESLACQSMAGIEILILDSSNDDSCAIVAMDYAERLPLRYFQRPDVKPWPTKTNIGVQMARADHIAMLHQDDLWLPGRGEAIRAAIEQYPGAALHIGPTQLVNEDGQTIGRWSLPLRTGLHAPRAILDRLIVQNFIAIPTPVIRRDMWMAVGGMDESLWYTADWDLYLKLAEQGSVAVSADMTAAFRIHARSLTMTGSRDSAAMREQHDAVLHRHGGNARRGTLRTAHASASINCALAAAAAGDKGGLPQALAALLRLGPMGALRYIRDSRIIDRVVPRLRARLSGGL